MSQRLIAIGTLALLLVGACTATEERPASPLLVRDAWARAADSGATGAVYLTLTNRDSVDVALTGLSTPAATAAELHETMQHEGMVHMSPRPTMNIPRDSTQSMTPGGLHVMLIELTRTLRAGDTVFLHLTFGDGRRLPATAVVRAP